MLALFHDKNVVIALILLYFVGFYCIGVSIKLVKNQACNEDQCSFATIPQKGHVRSICRKLKSQVSSCISRVFRKKCHLARYPRNSLTEEF